MPNPLNGAGPVRYSTDNETRYVKLPRELQTPALPGTPCHCPYCKAHPDRQPMWDTLGVPAHGTTWLVHWPDLK